MSLKEINQKLKSGEMRLDLSGRRTKRIPIGDALAKKLGMTEEVTTSKKTLSEAKIEAVRKRFYPDIDKETFTALSKGESFQKKLEILAED